MRLKKMNKKGAGMSGGLILIIAVVLVFGYTQGWLDFILNPAPTPPAGVVGNCPSSGLTEVTLNAQEALASTATNANVTYYIYDNGVLIKNGDTGSDGTVSVDVACGNGKTYSGLVLNEQVQTGFYPQEFTIDASGATDTHNFKMYEYGQVDVASVVSSADPTGAANISSGTGKTCGYTVTFSNNESASGIYNPLIMCLTNSTAVIDVTMDGVTEAQGKSPTRKTVPSGLKYFTFEYPKMIKSTDGAIKLSGKIQFSASATIPTANKNNMSCVVVDQAMYRVAEFKTLGLKDGFVTAAENQETIADIGAPDSDIATVAFAGTYC